MVALWSDGLLEIWIPSKCHIRSEFSKSLEARLQDVESASLIGWQSVPRRVMEGMDPQMGPSVFPPC